LLLLLLRLLLLLLLLLSESLCEDESSFKVPDPPVSEVPLST
jgi:hypothetical protein